MTWQEMSLSATALELEQRWEDIRQTEIRRFKRRLGELTPEQEAAVQELTRGLIEQVLFTPFATLRVLPGPSERQRMVQALRRIFNLEVAPGCREH